MISSIQGGRLFLLKAGVVEGGREGATWMCGRRWPRAPLERVELLEGAMGDGGGFLCHGNSHDGSEIRLVVASDGFFRH